MRNASHDEYPGDISSKQHLSLKCRIVEQDKTTQIGFCAPQLKLNKKITNSIDFSTMYVCFGWTIFELWGKFTVKNPIFSSIVTSFVVFLSWNFKLADFVQKSVTISKILFKRSENKKKTSHEMEESTK